MIADYWIECGECHHTYDNRKYNDCPVCPVEKEYRQKLNELHRKYNKDLNGLTKEFQVAHWEQMRSLQEKEVVR